MGHDHASAPKEGVASGVVAVEMRVEHESRCLAAKRLDGRQNARRQGHELVVDDEHAVLADADADIAATPFEHVDGAANMGRGDFHARERIRRAAERTGAGESGDAG